VAIDPNLAGAYAQLARAYNTLAFKFSSDTEAKVYHENAEVAILKSLALDPELAEGHFARGLILWTKTKGFPHELAIKSYKRSLELDPDDDETHHQLSMVYSHIGLLDEAEQSVHRALEINPNNTLARFRVGEVLLFKGKHEEALAALRNVPADANPSLVGYQIVLALFNLGRKEEAAATLEKFLKDYPEDNRGLFTSLQAMFAAADGQPRVAEEKIKLAIERGKGFGHFHHTAYHIACAYALMNRKEEAIKWLEFAADNGFPCYVLFATDHNLDSLRQHPRFQQFMARMKHDWERYKSLM